MCRRERAQARSFCGRARRVLRDVAITLGRFLAVVLLGFLLVGVPSATAVGEGSGRLRGPRGTTWSR